MHVPHTTCTATDVAKARHQQRPLCARVLPCLRALCPHLRVLFLRSFCALHLPARALPMPCAFCLHAFASHHFGRPTSQPLASVLLCSLYLICTSCPLFTVVVITVGAEILSLYPMPFLFLSWLTHTWRGPPLRACHVFMRVHVYVCVRVM